MAADAVTEIQSGLATAAALATVDGIVDDILVDTGTTLDTLIKDVPTVAEFEARTLVAADYVVTTDTIAGVTTVGSVTALGNDAITAASMHSDAGTEIATAVLAKVVEAQGSITLQQALQAILAATAGVVADATTSPILFKTPNGSRTTISAAVDGNGNRTSITFTFA